MPSLDSEHYARKADQGKPRFDLLPPEAWLLRLPAEDLIGAVRVLEFGAKKYAAHSWQDVPDGLTRYRAAAQRHVPAIALADGTAVMRDGVAVDVESGLPVRWHQVCDLIFVFALEARER